MNDSLLYMKETHHTIQDQLTHGGTEASLNRKTNAQYQDRPMWSDKIATAIAKLSERIHVHNLSFPHFLFSLSFVLTVGTCTEIGRS